MVQSAGRIATPCETRIPARKGCKKRSKVAPHAGQKNLEQTSAMRCRPSACILFQFFLTLQATPSALCPCFLFFPFFFWEILTKKTTHNASSTTFPRDVRLLENPTQRPINPFRRTVAGMANV